MGWGIKIKNPIKSVTKAVSKLGGAITKAGKSFAKSPFDAVRAIGRGDVSGLLDAAARGVSYGTLGLSNKALVNPVSVAKTLGMSTSAPGGVATTGMLAGISKKKGLLSQLRQGKGGEGGGSFTSTAKDPLGGEAGKTGK